MNLISFSILEHCDNKTLKKYSHLSKKIGELYEKRIEKEDFSEEINLINKIYSIDLIIKNN